MSSSSSSSSVIERYHKLCIKESLSMIRRYPIACKELTFIFRHAFHDCPKTLQSILFQDTLSAFRLLPQMQTQRAVTAVHLLLQSAEAALPKQKRNTAVTEFKQAMIAHKRHSKASRLKKGSLQVPNDLLVHIFSFLDMQSLVSAGQVCWLWNSVANDNRLWELQYFALYIIAATKEPSKLVEVRNNRLLKEPIDTRSDTDWKEAVKGIYTRALFKKLAADRGYCGHCKTVVWLNNLKCPNVHCGRTSETQNIMPVTTFQVVEYVLDDSLSSSDSDSDSKGGVFPRLWAYPKHIRK